MKSETVDEWARTYGFTGTRGIIQRPSRGTRNDIGNAVLCYCDGVTDVIVEDSQSRDIIHVGFLRITINGGRADDIAGVIHNVIPAVAGTEGFYEHQMEGYTIRFDHVNPIVDTPRPSLWQRIKAVFQ